MERKSRWWVNERYRADPSPERDFSTVALDTAASMRLLGNAMLSAATTKTTESNALTSGTLDLLMDSLMSSLGPLLALTSKFL
jgi:hypothetical protein